jgi:hypothetical protein
MATIWLEPAQRNRVQTILDAAAEEENERMKDEG